MGCFGGGSGRENLMFVFFAKKAQDACSPGGGAVLLGRCTLQLVYQTIATTQQQKMLLPLSPWHNNLTMTSRFWRHFQQIHANCHASIDRAGPAKLANAWQLAQVGRNCRQKTFARAAMQGCWAPPLSLADNIKFYFINITHYFNTRFYHIIQLY